MRGGLLLLIPVLALSHALSVIALAAFMTVFGFVALVGDAASQAFVPTLVPQALLTRAHARLDQSDAVAQTSGPALAGGLVSLIGAPLAVIVDAASYLFSALMLLGIRTPEPAPEPRPRGSLGKDALEGLRWVYRHPTLAPLALATHGWFIFSGAAGAVVAPFVLKSIGLPPFALGVALSMAGVGGLGGSLLSAQLGDRFGAGRTVVSARWLAAFAFVVLALSPVGWLGLPVLGLGQFFFGFSIGAENANEMAFRQTITPDRLQGRTNATMRSINRAMIVVAAPLGGLLADHIGYRPTLWIVAAGFAIVAISLGLSRFAGVRLDRLSATS